MQGLYRSVLYGQRALLLLDNAASREQVEPLIPPESCLLLVTSRRRFTLPGMASIDLGYLKRENARDLLLSIAPRIGGQADTIAELCGYLPFALRKAGSVLADRIDLSPKEYCRRLRESKARLDLIDASISVSYQLLPPELQRLWRALGVFPGTFDVSAATAVWEMGRDEAQDSLGALFSRSLVEWDPQRQRYRLHDLDRVYASTRLEEVEGDDGARRRHASHFKDVLSAADHLYLEGGERLTLGLALFDQELGNIQAGQAWAAAHAGEDDAAAALCRDYPDAGGYVLDFRLHAQVWIQWLEAALAAARRLKDRIVEGRRLSSLGDAYADLRARLGTGGAGTVSGPRCAPSAPSQVVHRPRRCVQGSVETG